ncbi:MAG: hypothetical protein HOO67_03495 [Candidatus Peribacteraceae bacterium]|nr:hypothetical protein [Candidatus Peribacteraceae bacterium]
MNQHQYPAGITSGEEFLNGQDPRITKTLLRFIKGTPDSDKNTVPLETITRLMADDQHSQEAVKDFLRKNNTGNLQQTYDLIELLVNGAITVLRQKHNDPENEPFPGDVTEFLKGKDPELLGKLQEVIYEGHGLLYLTDIAEKMARDPQIQDAVEVFLGMTHKNAQTFANPASIRRILQEKTLGWMRHIALTEPPRPTVREKVKDNVRHQVRTRMLPDSPPRDAATRQSNPQSDGTKQKP